MIPGAPHLHIPLFVGNVVISKLPVCCIHLKGDVKICRYSLRLVLFCATMHISVIHVRNSQIVIILLIFNEFQLFLQW